MATQQRRAFKEFEKQLKAKIMQKNATNMHEVQFMAKMFKYFDIQNRGKVTFEQFYRAMEKLGISMDQQALYNIFQACDKDGNGELDYKEFSTSFFQDELQVGNDVADPYVQEKERQLAANIAARHDSPDALFELFRDKIKARGTRGMVGLRRLFTIMDDDGSQTLSLPEFVKATRDFRVGISEENVPILFQKFDTNGDGTLNFGEFIATLRGPYPAVRAQAAEACYHYLDSVCGHGGVIGIKDLYKRYNTAKHPDVLQGLRCESNVRNEFVETFDAHHLLCNPDNDGVSLDEWMDFYHDFSTTCDQDDRFINIMNHVWGLADAQKKPQGYRGPQAQQPKGPVEPLEFRKGYEQKAVQRSGLESGANPLYQTKKYYGEKKTASMGNKTGAMQFGREPIDGQLSTGGIAFPSQVNQAQGGQGQQAKPHKTTFKVESKPNPPKFQGMLVERFRKALRQRGGNSIIGLQRQFKIADDDGQGTLNMPEFKKMINDFDVDIDQKDVQNLFKSIDYDRTGEISFDEFIRVVVGDMNEFRQNLVKRAFNKLDATRDGVITMKEFSKHYSGAMHPDVRSGKKTEQEVLDEFMDTFEQHHALLNQGATNDDMISLDEFMEYYNNISVNIDNDSYFDLMISNTWGLDGATNPASMPYAGVAKKVAKVNAREQYLQDHHRNLFGTDEATPFQKGSGAHWQSASHTAMAGGEVLSGDPAAGTTTFYNQDAYRNQFGSSRDSGAGYTGIRNKDDELVQKLRDRLAARGARGLIGLQRIFKILDDTGDGVIGIQEFWKGLCDFRLKFSEAECRRLFDLFDRDESGEIDFDELLTAIKGEMSPFRKDLIKRVFKKIDFNENGIVESDDIKQLYNAREHPDVKAGKKSADEVLQDFVETFEAHRASASNDGISKKGDGKVTLNEFIDYYSNVSASIDNDEYFQLMITNAWNLNNKQYSKAVRMEY